MGHSPPIAQIGLPEGMTVKAVILSARPRITALLYFDSLTNSQLQTGNVYRGCDRIHAEYGMTIKLDDLRAQVKKRWPEATIYRVPRIGSGALKAWQ